MALRCHKSTAVSCYLSEITQQRASSTHFVEYKPVLQIYSCQYTACEFIIIPGIPIFMVNSYQDKKIKNLMVWLVYGV